MRKVYCLVLVLLVMGCARQEVGETAVVLPTATCVPCTPTHSPTPTASATPMATAVPPASPTPPPTLFPPTTPESQSTDYQLRPWTDTAALASIHELSQIENAIELPKSQREHWALFASLEMALKEALLRFPHSEYETQIKWDLASLSAEYLQCIPPYYDCSTPYDDILSTEPGHLATKLLPELLQNELSVARLNLSGLKETLGSNGFSVQIQPVFRDTQNEVYILLVQSPTNVEWMSERPGIVVAIVSSNNQPEVMLLEDFWGFGGFRNIFVEDLTSDSTPEIITEQLQYGNKSCSVILNIYKWNDHGFVKINPTPLDASCSETPGWEIVPDSTGTGKIIQVYEYNQMYKSGNIIKQFAWNNTFIQPTRTIYPPLPKDLNHFAIWWIDKELYEMSQVAIVEGAYSRVLASWPIEGDEFLGASFPDYLRFRLALLQINQGKTEEARSQLQSLVNHPINPITTTVSAAAQAFLHHYQADEDLYRACDAALRVMHNAFPEERFLDPFPSFTDTDFQTYWGYGRTYSDAAICDLDTAIQLISESWQREPVNAIPDLLAEHGVSIQAAENLDLDGNGENDWLILVKNLDPTKTENRYSLWSFLSSDGRATAKLLTTYTYLDLPSSTLPLISYKSTEQTRPIHLLNFNKHLFIFSLFQVENNVVVSRYSLPEIQMITAYRLEIENHGFVLTTYSSAYSIVKKAVYGWQDGGDRFVLRDVESENEYGMPKDLVSAKVISYIFDYQEPEKAIPLLLQLINPPEQDPRPLYLLGLAYELSGDETSAVDAYWTLWQTFPESPYALLAQAKLELEP